MVSILDSQCHSSIYWAKPWLLFWTSVISIMVVHFECKNKCNAEKNFHIAFILPIRWQNCTEALGIETTRCQWFLLLPHKIFSALSELIFVFFKGQLDVVNVQRLPEELPVLLLAGLDVRDEEVSDAGQVAHPEGARLRGGVGVRRVVAGDWIFLIYFFLDL